MLPRVRVVVDADPEWQYLIVVAKVGKSEFKLLKVEIFRLVEFKFGFMDADPVLNFIHILHSLLDVIGQFILLLRLLLLCHPFRG